MTEYEALIALRKAYKAFMKETGMSKRLAEMRIEKFPKLAFTNEKVAPGFRYMVKYDCVEPVIQVEEEIA